MTHRPDDTTISHVMETLIANGLEGMAGAVSVLMNEAMKLAAVHWFDALALVMLGTGSRYVAIVMHAVLDLVQGRRLAVALRQEPVPA